MLPKSERKYLYLLAAAFIALCVVEYLRPQPIDWTPSFSRNDKIPYGTAGIYELLPSLFPEKHILSNQLTFFELEEAGMLYDYRSIIIINDEINFDENDWDVLRNWVEEGNSLFLATSQWGNRQVPSELSVDIEGCFRFWMGKDAEGKASIDSAAFNFTNKAIQAERPYRAPLGLCDCYAGLHLDDSSDTLTQALPHVTVLGKQGENPNFVAIKVGKGTVYLHTNPLLFTNYYLTHPNGASYLEKAFSYLPNGPVIWDEYYKIGREGSQTPLRVILSKPALRGAWYLALFSIILFVLFNVKRQQRAIPVVKPPENTTVEFVETIGRLYFQHGDHKDLASKIEIFFKDHVRRKYFIKLSGEWTKEELERLALKSGVPEGAVSDLFAKFARLQRQAAVEEAELLALRAALVNFHQQSK